VEATSAVEEFRITRVFDAPRDLVYAVWTEAHHLERWWGPKGFSIRVAKLEVAPGGMFHYYLQNPQGVTMWGKWVFRDVAPADRLEFLASFSNEQGETVRAFFSPDYPLEVLSTVTFTDEGEGRTRVSMRGIPVNASEAELRLFGSMAQSMTQGWTGTLDQLEAYLASQR
jgi:uncharacterized protein YndB with AHSA1/START domain